MPNITFQMGALPSGFIGTPQDFANAIAAGLIGVFPAGALGLSGQINGANPGNQNIGLWFNGVSGWYFFNTGSSSYVPDESSTPIGSILPFPGPVSQVPANFLLCDGTSYLRATYPILFSRIGTIFGTADSTHFNVPACVSDLKNTGFGARLSANLAGGAITSYNILVAGQNYSGKEVVFVNGGGGMGSGGPGSGATATLTITNGVVTSLTLTSAGSGYVDGTIPAVSFSGGGGSGATATAVVQGGVLTGITLTAGGSGYTSAPTVTIGAPPSVSTATATSSTTSTVTAITLATAGSGYLDSNPPAVTITAVGAGSGAKAYAVVKRGLVVAIVVTAPGSGYTSGVTVAIAAPTAAATATATASTSSGIITAVTPVANGSGFSTTPDVFIGAAPAVIRAS